MLLLSLASLASLANPPSGHIAAVAAAAAMAEDWIVQTQSTLGTLVKKPKLSDNLLKKPPFRFIHGERESSSRLAGPASAGGALGCRAPLSRHRKMTVILCLLLVHSS